LDAISIVCNADINIKFDLVKIWNGCLIVGLERWFETYSTTACRDEKEIELMRYVAFFNNPSLSLLIDKETLQGILKRNAINGDPLKVLYAQYGMYRLPGSQSKGDIRVSVTKSLLILESVTRNGK
jgi:hypothetical protein